MSIPCSPTALALIRDFEGCELTVYEDVAGLNTVGVGHRTDLEVGETISQEEADSYLEQDAQSAANCVDRACPGLTENQRAALCAFVFNVGCGAFKISTLLKCIQSGNLDAVPEQLARWNRTDGRVSAGLTRRRQTEAALWRTP